MLELFLSKLKVVLKNPLIVFIYGMISKWYIAILITAIVVTFWVFKGLSQAGIIDAAEKVVFKAFNEAKSVAKHCVPKITRFGDFWNCLENPPKYVPDENERKLEEGLNDLLDFGNYNQNEDPYSESEPGQK